MRKILPVSVSVGGVCRYEVRCVIEAEAGSRGFLLKFYVKLSQLISHDFFIVATEPFFYGGYQLRKKIKS